MCHVGSIFFDRNCPHMFNCPYCSWILRKERKKQMIKEELKIVEAAKIARKHRLFVSGWFLSHELWEISNGLKPSHNYKICFYYQNNIPVGICLRKKRQYKYGHSTYQLMVFVRKAYRHKGIGRSLVNFMKVPNCFGQIGIKDSKGKIWKMNGVEMKA